MTVLIEAVEGGWNWRLETRDGQLFAGFESDFAKMWNKIFYLNSLVIDHEAA